jgi:hypothetical protein
MKLKWLPIVFICCCQLASAQVSAFHYLSPRPNSILNSRESRIIIRQGSTIDQSSIDPVLLSVKGSESGIHQGSVQLADDHKTIVFCSFDPFTPNETVTVALAGGIRTTEGGGVGTLTYAFRISPLTGQLALSMHAAGSQQLTTSDEEPAGIDGIAPVQTDSVPADLPKITVGTSNNPSDGKIFLANQSQTTTKSIGPYLMIFNNDGSIIQYKKLSKSANGFKMEPNGDLSYNLKGSGSRVILDTAMAPIDTMNCNYGYKINGHDFLLLPNGHTIYIAEDSEPVDMSQVVVGGNPDAIVAGCAVQELDAAGNLVFQWRSWDDLPITASYFDLTVQNIDLTHQNGLAVDREGNILVSLRHLSCIVKLNRETGKAAWILGGKLNEFTFINEHASNAPTYFSYQHNIDVLPNGNITLFDNGTQHSPSYSRGVEYQLNEDAKTATMVWEYRHSPDMYADAMGSVQRLANGNTLIGWGNKSADGTAVCTEVHPDNSIALELFLPKGQFCYRAYKYPWVSRMPKVSVTAHEVLQGNTYSFKNGTDSTGITLKFTKLDALMYANAIVTNYAYAPQSPEFLADAPALSASYFTLEGQEINSFSGQAEVSLRSFPEISQPQRTYVYVRPQFGSVFIQLPTSYDAVKNALVFTTSYFGEYAFGIPQSLMTNAPAAIVPKNEEIVNGESSVELQWGTRGLFQTCHLQVATDPAFQHLVADLPELAATSCTLNTLANNTAYSWRVSAANSSGTSDWSAVSSFRTASPYIAVTYPNGGEHLFTDSTYVIRWQSNVHDTVNVELMKGSTVAAVIADSLVSGTNALLWQVPAAMKADSSYTVRITSVNRAALSDASESVFAIGSGITSVAGSSASVSTFALGQNYPNPFNPSTVISYQLPVSAHVMLKVFDIMGRDVRTLVDERKNAGTHAVTLDASGLPSGVYFYRLQAGSFVQSKKLMLLK